MRPMTEPLLMAADAALRTLFARSRAKQACPTVNENRGNPLTMSNADQELSAGLMRVNHTGEVCAQALYTSQALGARLFSKNEPLARHMEAAGRDETDHLAWTEDRLQALNSRPSLLNPLWYVGAFGIGLLASRMGEKVSLGFVAETEQQVESHLLRHLDRLPMSDQESRAVVAQMRIDESRHAREAQQAGAAELPQPVKVLMKSVAKIMTVTAQRI